MSSLDRRSTSLQVPRAFTVFQLMTVLEDSHHSLLIIEHDPLLYQDAEEMVEYVSQAMGGGEGLACWAIRRASRGKRRTE